MESLITIQVLLICLNENCDCVLTACSTDSFVSISEAEFCGPHSGATCTLLYLLF